MPRPDPTSFTFTPLTPVTLLDRRVAAFGDRTAIVDGELRWTYHELAER